MIIKTVHELVHNRPLSEQLTHIFELSVGDDVLSDEGFIHGCSTNVLFTCSHPMSEVVTAYQQSVIKYGIDVTIQATDIPGLEQEFIVKFNDLFDFDVTQVELDISLQYDCGVSEFADIYMHIASLSLSGLAWNQCDFMNTPIGGSALMSPV
jgi:hypothetical protein